MGAWVGTISLYDSFFLLNDMCPSNTTSWTDSPASHSTRIKAVHINELRTAIQAEQTRRHLTPSSFGAALVKGNVVRKTETSVLKDSIESMRSCTWTYNYALIKRIDSAIINEVRSNLNSIQTDCLCNCNYCTCNCNYCTCNCNYCTCDCNYCTCNCNYSCTCNCNYSDRNLKREIEYL